jgi:hypothetical protein
MEKWWIENDCPIVQYVACSEDQSSILDTP